MSSISRLGRNSRGFTLVESLIALAIMMILMSAIGGLSATSLRATQHVERHLADIEHTQQILAGLPSRLELMNSPVSGETEGYRWRLDAAPFDAVLVKTVQTGWTPEKIVLTVQSPSGAPMSFDIVRLVRTVAK